MHRHGNADWEESIFHRKALPVRLLGVQCMRYQEKRRARRGKANTLQQPDRKSAKMMLEKVLLFAGLGQLARAAHNMLQGIRD